MHASRRSFTRIIILAAALLAVLPRAGALGPEDLLLVVNRNVPEGVELARHYAKARGVPDGRIVELDLPSAEEISFDQFESSVVPPLRQFLRDNGLEQQVRCLVSFYGVPLRIVGRKLSPQEQAELDQAKAELEKLTGQLKPLVSRLEDVAIAVDASYVAPGTDDPSQAGLQRRANHALNFINQNLPAVKNADERRRIIGRMNDVMVRLTGSPSGVATAAKADLERIAELQWQRYDPAARAEVRALSGRLGLFDQANVLSAHAGYLVPEHTEAALDSELSLLWWSIYPRTQWQPNLLNHRLSEASPAAPVLMVMRLDGPTPQRVREMIDESIEVESRGLRGRIVLDARGIAARKPDGSQDPYGVYDQLIRNLAAHLKAQTTLEVILDDEEPVIPAGTHEGVAIYCGWYSLANYVPSVKLIPGAVAYHIASLEMTSLHDVNNNGWVRRLLADGAAASLGPVAEPYLHAFPMPDEFFPLLMTGKLTLAEVFWKTQPMTSWRVAAVGDPLYTPFKTNPALTREQLPDRLRQAISEPATQPADAGR